MKKSMSLCEGRHPIPQATDGSIFPSVVNPLDINGMATIVADRLFEVNDLDLYVTGLTVALVEVIKYCETNNVGLTLYHFDRDSGNYYPQVVVSNLTYCPFCGNVVDWSWTYCPNCGAS